MPKNEGYTGKGQQKNQRRKDNINKSSTSGNSSNNRGNYYNYYGKKNRRPKVRSNNAKPRYNRQVRANETIEDIKNDISRIEKEIQLELKEIRSLKFGF